MIDNISNNKRIAKNTLMMSIRSFLILLISLYTVRVLLHALGKVDYGINNVVGGIVVMFSFVSSTLSAASSRYFAYELGRKDEEALENVFSVMLRLYIFIALVILFLAETLGLWFFHTKLNIPPDRMYAAGWVFHLSVFSFCLKLLTTPYIAMILSYEKMDIYAYMGILEVVLQLLLTFVVNYADKVDSLILYAVLISVNSVVINSCYFAYAWKLSKACHKMNYWDGALAKEVASFSGWNIFGAVSSVVRGQGINMLLGTFFSPVVNAARGIAYQISNALNQLSHNFYAAVRPQVTKRYSSGDIDETFNLVFTSSKFTFYLFLFVGASVYVYIEPILTIWLHDVPEYTIVFARFVILTAMVDSLSHPLMALSQATGKVALYQSVVGTITILNLPAAWIFLSFGYPASSVFKVILMMSFLSLSARLVILRKIVNLPIMSFLREVILPIIMTGVAVFAATYMIKIFLFDELSSFIELIGVCAFSVCLSATIIYYIGLTQIERTSVVDYFKHYLVNKA